MAKYVYSAVFTKEESGLYAVDFPDIAGCHTSGDNILDAVEMAQDALSMMLRCLEKDGEPIPEPTPINKIETDKDSFSTLIVGDTTDYNIVECAEICKTK